MHRLLALAVSLLVVLLAPGAAATNPPAPTLTGTDHPLVTELSWSAPAGASVASWTLYRYSMSGELDIAWELGPATTFFDHVPPPGDAFAYQVRYTTPQGNVSEPSDYYVRFSDIRCDPYPPQGWDSIMGDVRCVMTTVCDGVGGGNQQCNDVKDLITAGPCALLNGWLCLP